MNPTTLVQFAKGAGVAGLASGVVWLIAFFRCRARRESPLLQMRTELTAIIDEQSRQFAARLVEVDLKLDGLNTQESGSIPLVRSGIGRNHRSRAIQLLRSGLAPGSVALNLSLGAREIHLIAAVSRALTTHKEMNEEHQ